MRRLVLLGVMLAWLPAPGLARCEHFALTRQPFFGDLHVHTRYSLDAATQATLTTPDQAYRFAKGEPLGIQPWLDGKPGRTIQIGRPLDFAMVSDHAELMGEISICGDPDKPGHNAWQCGLYRNFPRAAYYWFNYWSSQHGARAGFCTDADCKEAALGPWQDTQAAAEAHYDRSSTCAFTTFVGYEWTGGISGDNSGNIHRNVVFKGGEVPRLPISFMDGQSPFHLFSELDRQCAGNCEALVIPHNSNLSAGIMFEHPVTADQARIRHRYEVLAEIMQHKGASECYFDPLGASDEYCNFEQLSERSFTDSDPPRREDGFLRTVLGEGLQAMQQWEVNPFQFGFVGSTDTHLGAPGYVEEDRFAGHGGAGVPAADAVPEGLPDHLQYNPGGLAVLWAEENTRDSLFAAMRRREAYATSGPRMQVRLFAGEDLPVQMCGEDFATLGYAHGVPMGGELHEAQSMRLAVQAMQDADSVGLSRTQIIKGWVDEAGEAHERVFDVTVAPDTHVVDAQTCEVRGRSAATLCSVWQDPEFNPAHIAFYYARVLEGPSCRWSQRMCVAGGIRCDDPSTMKPGFEDCCTSAHEPVIHERAWTSPVWYHGDQQ